MNIAVSTWIRVFSKAPPAKGLMSSVFSDQGNGVSSIFVMNKSHSMRALRLGTKNSIDCSFSLLPFPPPHPHPYEVDVGVDCVYGVYEEMMIY